MSSTFARKVIDVLITVVIVVLIAFALLWFVHTFNVFELPLFIRRILEPDIEQVSTVDRSEADLLELIESEEYISGDYTYVSLTADKAKQLLRSVPQAESFYWNVETAMTYGGSVRTQKHFVYKQNDKIRVDTEEDGTMLTTVFADGKVFSVNTTTGARSEFGGDTDFSYTNIINAAALEYFFNDEDAEVNYVAVVNVGDEQFLYVEIPKSSINGVDKYVVSLVHGTVMYASSVLDGIEYFTQKTVEFNTDSVIPDSAFEFSASKAREPLMLQ